MTRLLHNTIEIVTELSGYHLELIRLQEISEKKKTKIQQLGLNALEQNALLELGSSTQKTHELCLRASIATLTDKYKQSIVLLRPDRERTESIGLAVQLYSAAAHAGTRALRSGYKNQRCHTEVLNDVRDVFLETFLFNLNEVLDIQIESFDSELNPEPEIDDLLNAIPIELSKITIKSSPVSAVEAVFTPEIKEPCSPFIPISGPKK